MLEVFMLENITACPPRHSAIFRYKIKFFFDKRYINAFI